MDFDKVLCIDDSNRPNEIPTSKWLKKDAIYTVDKVGKDYAGVYFFFLKEIEGTAPYLGFNINRFRPIADLPTMEEIEKALMVEEEVL
jgi:hypothetical protein